MYATRILSSLGAVLALAALAVPAAFATGPDDRDYSRATAPALTAGPGADDRTFSRSPGLEVAATTRVSPDDRPFVRSVDPIQTPPPVEVVVEPRGFDWGDAVIGAAGALGIAALLTGAALLGRSLRRQEHGTSPTVGSV